MMDVSSVPKIPAVTKAGTGRGGEIPGQGKPVISGLSDGTRAHRRLFGD